MFSDTFYWLAFKLLSLEINNNFAYFFLLFVFEIQERKQKHCFLECFIHDSVETTFAENIKMLKKKKMQKKKKSRIQLNGINSNKCIYTGFLAKVINFKPHSLDTSAKEKKNCFSILPI
jgi:hypothetical protein